MQDTEHLLGVIEVTGSVFTASTSTSTFFSLGKSSLLFLWLMTTPCLQLLCFGAADPDPQLQG